MAALPSLSLDQLQGARPSDMTVTPTDFGLGQASQQLEGVEVAQRRASMMASRADAAQDRVTAGQIVQKYLPAITDDYASSAAGLTPDTAVGFAAGQIAKTRAGLQPALDEATTPGVKGEVQRAIDTTTSQFGQQAIAHEAQVRAQPIAEAAAAQQQVALNNSVGSFSSAYATSKQTIADQFDGSQPGYATAIGTAFDAAAAQTLAAAPADQQPRLQAQLSAMRAQEVAQAAAVEAKTTSEFIATNTQKQAGAQIDTIVSNPSSYDMVVSHILPSVVANLPPGLRTQALQDFTAQAATARIKGLVDAGNPDQAKAELADGRYDAFMPPTVKEELLAHVDAAQREKGPKTFDQYMAAAQTESNLNADVYARATTGTGAGVNLDAVVAQLGPEKGAEYALKAKAADQAFAVTGAARNATTPQLQQQAAQAPPAPTDPDYTTKLTIWQAQTQAAQRELKARTSDPGSWAWATNPNLGKGKGGAAAQGQAVADSGAQLQGMYSAALNATGPVQAHLMTSYADSMLGHQEAAGVPKAAWQIVPATEASRIAASVTGAPPDQMLKSMQGVAGLVAAMPDRVRAQDGSIVSPRALFVRQLQDAGMTPIQASAVADFGADPVKLGRVVAAMNDPTLKKPLERGQEQQLVNAVNSALAPFLQSQQPLPGAQAIAQARIDRTVLVARGLMADQGMNAAQAARTAAMDLTGGYVYQNGYRIPVAQTGGYDLNPMHPYYNGQGAIRVGASAAMADLTANNGAHLFAPDGPGTPADQRQILAAQLHAHGRWVTNADDSGLTMMLPKPDGSFAPVLTNYGQPVTMSWDQLKARANGAPTPMTTPPPGSLQNNGQPVPAFTTTRAFQALSQAVTQQESGGRNGLVSGAGAMGVMQVTPATAAGLSHQFGEAAPDLNRLQSDPAYNTKYGQAALSQAISRRGTGAGLGLALVDYNAGPGHLDGYRNAQGQWVPGWLQTIGDPRKPGGASLTDFVSRIPIPETRKYVQAVLPRALGYLQK